MCKFRDKGEASVGSKRAGVDVVISEGVSPVGGSPEDT